MSRMLRTEWMNRQRMAGKLAKNKARRRLQAELLEDRRVLACIVSSTADSGPGTLRDCVDNSVDPLIAFSIPPESVITLTSGQLLVDRSVTIDGSNCDFNEDGNCNVTDLNMLMVNNIDVNLSGAPDLEFDLNGDLTVNNADRDLWLASAASVNGFDAPFQSGDWNLDGIKDGPDFLRWNANKFTYVDATLDPWSRGETDGNGFVNGNDFLYWNAPPKFQLLPAGGGNIVIMQTGAGRVMEVTDGDGYVNTIEVTLLNLTITGGNVDGDGGGIRNVERLTIQDCTITGNMANRLGAVYTAFGGGIANQGDLTLVGSTVSNNTATGVDVPGFLDAIGGGIAISGYGTLSMSSSTVSGNVAKDHGGGIDFSNGMGPHSITDSTVTNNTAGVGIVGTSARGGGLRAVGAGLDLTIEDSFVDDNSAGVNSAPGVTTFQYGGGIDISGSGVVNIVNTSVSGNALTGITNGNNAISRGGGIAIRSANSASVTVTITDSLISGNTADPMGFTGYGGGVSVGTSGGSIYSYTIIQNTDITSNSAPRGAAIGSRLMFGRTAYLDVTGGSMSGNTSTLPPSGGGGGGVMWAWSRQVSTFDGVDMSNNVSLNGGGAFFNSAGAFANNPNVYNRYGNSDLTIDNSTISGNTSADIAGAFELGTANLTYPGMYLNSVTINNSTISGNSAQTGGGAIENYDSALVLFQVTGSGNSTATGPGGFLWHLVYGGYDGTNKEGYATLERSTITLNSASYGGGAQVDYYANLTMSGSIISGNSATGFSPELYTYNYGITAYYSLVRDNAGSGLAAGNPDPNGNKIGTSGSPIDAMLGPLQDNGGPTLTHLPDAGSPAIDAGDPSIVGGTDQRGFSRVVNGRVDMGSVEYGSSILPVGGVDRALPRGTEDLFGDLPARKPGAAMTKASRARAADAAEVGAESARFQTMLRRRADAPTRQMAGVTIMAAANAAPAIGIGASDRQERDEASHLTVVDHVAAQLGTARVVPGLKLSESGFGATSRTVAEDEGLHPKALDLLFANLSR